VADIRNRSEEEDLGNGMLELDEKRRILRREVVVDLKNGEKSRRNESVSSDPLVESAILLLSLRRLMSFSNSPRSLHPVLDFSSSCDL
jgi:hypothetical protein